MGRTSCMDSRIEELPSAGADVPSTAKRHTGRDEFIENTKTVVEAALALSPAIPVPIVSSILASAKVIVDTAISIRHDKKTSIEIAEHAADLAASIKATARLSERGEEFDDEIKAALCDIDSVLDRIKVTLRHQASLGAWSRMKNRARISQSIKDSKEEMEGALRKFSVLSQVRLEMKVKEVSNALKLPGNNKRHADGYRRLFIGDIEFSDSLVDGEDVYIVKRKGEVKMVKQVRKLTVVEAQLTVLKMLRSKPNIRCVQLEAYSELIPNDGTFLMFHGDLILASSFMKTFEDDPLKHYSLVKQTGIDMRDTFTFLRSLDIEVHPHPTKLVVDRFGRAIFGLIEDMCHRPGISETQLYEGRDDVYLEAEHVILPSTPKAAHTLIGALNARSSGEKRITPLDQLFDGFYSLTSKVQQDDISMSSKKWRFGIGGFICDTQEIRPIENPTFKRSPNTCWKYAYEPDQEPDFLHNEDWETTGVYNFVKNKNLHGEIVRVSDGLKSGQDGIRYFSMELLQLKEAIEDLFYDGIVASEINGVPLEQISIVTSLTVDLAAEFEITSLAGHDAELYFHMNPRYLLNGWNPSPWGHLSRRRECVEDFDTCAQTSLTSVAHDEAYDGISTVYRQELDGICMTLYQSCEGFTRRMTQDEASLIRWIRETPVKR